MNLKNTYVMFVLDDIKVTEKKMIYLRNNKIK